MAARTFRLITSIVTSLDKKDIVGDVGKGFSFRQVKHSSLEAVVGKLGKKKLDIDATIEAELLDELSEKATALFTKGLPADLADLMVNDSRPTGIPEIWRKTGGVYYLHPIAKGADPVSIAGDADPVPIAYGNAKATGSKVDLWSCACVMAYEL